MLLTLQILVFSLTLWLGLYLLSRDPGDSLLRWSSAGLIAYALSVAGSALLVLETGSGVSFQQTVHAILILLPALCWSGALLALLPESDPWRIRLTKAWPVVFVIILVALILLFAMRFQNHYTILLTMMPLLAAFILLARNWRGYRGRKGLGIALAATIFLLLGLGLILLPVAWLNTTWVLLAISIDFLLFGLAIAWLDAFDQGETFMPDLMRSFDYTFLIVLAFAGQIVLVMWLATGVMPSMVVLLFTTISAAILIQTFANPVQTWIDRFALSRVPDARSETEALRTASDARPRRDDSLDLQALSEDEFAHLTRRALSHFGHLPRLATSPLTHLPQIEARLAERRAELGTLERANELKALLVESIDRLKPEGNNGFSSTDEWRFFNAVYYPYVVGLKPYRRRFIQDDLDEDTQAAYDWFRNQVPERTLYNWQKAAAHLIARDLRERSGMV